MKVMAFFRKSIDAGACSFSINSAACSSTACCDCCNTTASAANDGVGVLAVSRRINFHVPLTICFCISASFSACSALPGWPCGCWPSCLGLRLALAKDFFEVPYFGEEQIPGRAANGAVGPLGPRPKSSTTPPDPAERSGVRSQSGNRVSLSSRLLSPLARPGQSPSQSGREP